MIAVLADDFTGAAEIGGIGYRNGLKTFVQTEPSAPPNDTELLVIARDLRSMPPVAAADEVMRLLKKLRPMSWKS